MDHHCPWINNCIGFYNQKHFVLFLFYTEVAMLFALGMFITRYAICAGKDMASCHENEHFVWMGSMIALGFIPFVGYLLVTQLRCIAKNISGIDEL
jgi:hypothetical protein